MADIKQLNQQIENLKLKKENIEKKVEMFQMQIDKLRQEQDKIQEQINKIEGVQEDSDAIITTTTAGNVSTINGRGNYAPKIGKPLIRKRTNVGGYLDNLFK